MKPNLKISVSVALPVDVLPRLESRAREKGLTRSAYLREIVLKSLAKSTQSGRRVGTLTGQDQSDGQL